MTDSDAAQWNGAFAVEAFYQRMLRLPARSNLNHCVCLLKCVISGGLTNCGQLSLDVAQPLLGLRQLALYLVMFADERLESLLLGL